MHPDIVVCELLAVEAVAGKEKLKKCTVSDGHQLADDDVGMHRRDKCRLCGALLPGAATAHCQLAAVAVQVDDQSPWRVCAN